MKLTAILCLPALCTFASAQTFINLANLDAPDASPVGLLQGSDGNFYGVTRTFSPATGPGVVFKVTPSGALSTLYTFTPAWVNSLIQGSDGNLYGTTSAASANQGTIFQLTTAGTLTTLYSFSGPDGEAPTNLVQATDGNFYGITFNGGSTETQADTGDGTIFKMTPSGTLTTLHNFVANDGAFPNSFIQASDGNFYGTTYLGGPSNVVICNVFLNGIGGCGTVFKITPAGVFSTLHQFAGGSDGKYPSGEFFQTADGTIYGVAFGGGPTLRGIIFSMTSSGTITYLADDTIGVVSMLAARDGNFYGVAGNEMLFELTPSGTFTTLHIFCGEENCPTGPAYPNSLIQGADGNLYGTTRGGTSPNGTVFEWAFTNPDTPAISATGGVLNGASFQPGISDGSWMTINGTNLSATTDTWNNSIVNGVLPTTLDGVGVMVGGQAAYIEYVSPTQINAIAPNVPVGSVPVTVTTAIGTSQAAMTQLSAETPAFFQWGTYAVATRQDFSYAVKNGGIAGLTTTPAKPGDVIILWGTGFGATSPAAPAGMQTPSSATYNTATAVSVTVGGKSATVYGAALAPGYAGLYQVAIQIPASLANGDYPVVATINGSPSLSTTLITVQQ
jgi:uncharacterized protein (TIGR03437 family)